MSTRLGYIRLAIAVVMGLCTLYWVSVVDWNGDQTPQGDYTYVSAGIAVTIPPTTTTPATTTTVARTTTTPEPTTTIDEGWLCPDAIHIARMVGWQEAELVTLDAIVYRESRCDGRQHNTDDPASGSRGLLQINGYWCKTTDFLQQAGVLWDCDDLFDDVTSMKAGLVIWTRSGWSPWGGSGA